MGEVYRARDTKLDRDVAIKILPAAFASDPERLARFKREAQVLASLNHPNIGAHLRAGRGRTGSPPRWCWNWSRDRRSRIGSRAGRSRVDEALPIARQIADALEAAHEQGIIHRDLKPANIKVRDGRHGEGARLRAGEGRWSRQIGSDGPAGRRRSRRRSRRPAMTAAGMILGTAAYMSPEQAKGRPVDKRSDIWAFGCVLYEMLTGKRAFDGEDVVDTLAAILRTEPDWSALPPLVPRRVHEVLKRCLAEG